MQLFLLKVQFGNTFGTAKGEVESLFSHLAARGRNDVMTMGAQPATGGRLIGDPREVAQQTSMGVPPGTAVAVESDEKAIDATLAAIADDTIALSVTVLKELQHDQLEHSSDLSVDRGAATEAHLQRIDAQLQRVQAALPWNSMLLLLSVHGSLTEVVGRQKQLQALPSVEAQPAVAKERAAITTELVAAVSSARPGVVHFSFGAEGAGEKGESDVLEVKWQSPAKQ